MPKSSYAVLLLCVAACGTLKDHHVITGTPRAAQEGDVRIIMEHARAPESFEEVAIVQSVGTGTKTDLEDLVEGLTAEARRLGCNAVVRVRVDLGNSHATAVGVAGVVP